MTLLGLLRRRHGQKAAFRLSGHLFQAAITVLFITLLIWRIDIASVFERLRAIDPR